MIGAATLARLLKIFFHDACFDGTTSAALFSAYYRDAIDLGYLVRANGSIPPRAIAKAEAAYGTDIARSVFAVLERLSGASEVEYAATGLGMSSDEISEAASRLRDAASTAWGAANSPRP